MGFGMRLGRLVLLRGMGLRGMLLLLHGVRLLHGTRLRLRRLVLLRLDARLLGMRLLHVALLHGVRLLHLMLRFDRVRCSQQPGQLLRRTPFRPDHTIGVILWHCRPDFRRGGMRGDGRRAVRGGLLVNSFRRRRRRLPGGREPLSPAALPEPARRSRSGACSAGARYSVASGEGGKSCGPSAAAGGRFPAASRTCYCACTGVRRSRLAADSAPERSAAR